MIPRLLGPTLRALARKVPVVTVFGPRQSGKTMLCRAAFPRKPYANLEAPDVRQFALEDPRGFLRQFPAGALLRPAVFAMAGKAADGLTPLMHESRLLRASARLATAPGLRNGGLPAVPAPAS